MQTHGKVRINTGVMPVINNVNGMTNQSGKSYNLLADRRGSAGKMNGNVASTGDRADFHNTSAGISHIASVLALQHVSCCCSS
ncbi:hypothetical protein KZ773_07870 [Escherichia coli]|nr:hypothetical protein [Escherichia coli]